MKRACLVILVLGGIALGVVVFLVKRSAEQRNPWEPAGDQPAINWRPPPEALPDIDKLEDRFEEHFEQLLEQAHPSDKWEPEAWWSAFSKWLDDQDDIPRKTRRSFRQHLRAELGLPPE